MPAKIKHLNLNSGNRLILSLALQSIEVITVSDCLRFDKIFEELELMEPWIDDIAVGRGVEPGVSLQDVINGLMSEDPRPGGYKLDEDSYNFLMAKWPAAKVKAPLIRFVAMTDRVLKSAVDMDPSES